ncbi:hypothetical protein ACFLXO_03240 [Chloroflexota bacterium]
MMNELSSFIDKVYKEPYSLFGNNCINKSLKIKARAEELGKRADLICCISIVKIKKWHNFPTLNPHLYLEIEGKKVDVSLDPGHEEIYCKNSEKKLIMPVNISRLRRALSRIRIPEHLFGGIKGRLEEKRHGA